MRALMGKVLTGFLTITLLFCHCGNAVCTAGVSKGKEALNASTPLRPLSLKEAEEIFRKTILAYSPWNPQDVEIKGLRVYPSNIKVPKKGIRLEARPPANGRYLGRVTIPVNILSGQDLVHRVQVSGQVEVYRNVVCAVRGLNKGDRIEAKDITLSKRPLSRLYGEPVTNPKEILGLQLKRGIRAGEVIKRRFLMRPILVRRGQIVTVLARTSHITLSLPGKAEDSGAKGEVIRVKNLSSKKVILAEVKAPRVVIAQF